MRKSLWLLLAFCPLALGEMHIAEYGVQYVAPFKLYNADGTLDTDEVDSGTEVSVRCQSGTNATATNDFVDKGSDYEITLTASEMQCKTIAVTVAATTTEVFYINTVNHASALIPWVDADVISVSGDSTAADNIELAYDGTAGSVTHHAITDQGTAQAVTASTIRLRSAAAFADDELIGQTVWITSATTGTGQSRSILDYTSSTDTATISTGTSDWTITPTGTILYQVVPTAPNNLSAAVTKIDNIYTAFELDTSVYRLTTNALEQAPAADSGLLDETSPSATTGGSTTSVVDNTLTFSTNTLVDAEICFTSGVNAPLCRTIASNDGTADSISWNEALPAAVANGVTFDLRRGHAPRITANGINAASLASDVATEIASVVVEDQGSTSDRCALAVVMAVLAGDWTTDGATTTFLDPTGSEIRLVSTVSAGGRTATITCPTY